MLGTTRGNLVNTSARDGSAHYYSHDEVRAFATFINQQLGNDPDLKGKLPVDPNDHEKFFAMFEDGVILCKMVNAVSKGSIDPKHITNKQDMAVHYKIQNLNVALGAAKEIGIKLTNIGYDDFLKGNRHVMLGLVWQIIKFDLLKNINMVSHPEIVHLLSRGEDAKAFSNLDPDKVILRWFNHNLQKAGHNRQVNNFGSDLQDGQNYLVLMNQIAPHIVPKTVLQEQNPQKRAEIVCDMGNRMGVDPYITPSIILKGGPESLNLAFVADMFNKYSQNHASAALDAQQQEMLADARRQLEDQYNQQEAARAARWADEENQRKAQWAAEDAMRQQMRNNWAKEDEDRRRQLEDEAAQMRANLLREEEERRRRMDLETQQQRDNISRLQADNEKQREQWAKDEEERRRKYEEDAKRREEEGKRREEGLRREEEAKRREAELRMREEQARLAVATTTTTTYTPPPMQVNPLHANPTPMPLNPIPPSNPVQTNIPFPADPYHKHQHHHPPPVAHPPMQAHPPPMQAHPPHIHAHPPPMHAHPPPIQAHTPPLSHSPYPPPPYPDPYGASHTTTTTTYTELYPPPPPDVVTVTTTFTADPFGYPHPPPMYPPYGFVDPNMVTTTTTTFMPGYPPPPY